MSLSSLFSSFVMSERLTAITLEREESHVMREINRHETHRHKLCAITSLMSDLLKSRS